MYCGDETGAFIGEVGYSSSKFGYGGEDVPKLVVPSYVSYDQNQKKIIASGLEYGPTHRPNPTLELVHVYDHPSSWNNSDSDSIADQYLQSNGSINNWNAYENLWERAFYDLHVRDSRKWSSSSSSSSKAENSCPHPICSIDQGFTSNNTNNTTNNTTAKKQNRQREKIMELLFEKFDAPAVFIAPSPACSAFSVGRPTSLVLDMGGGGCRATPIFDGLILRTAQRRNGRGGEWLSYTQYRMLLDDVGIPIIHPRYAAASGWTDTSNYLTQASPSYHWNAVANIMYEMKTGSHAMVPSRQQQPLPLNDDTTTASSYYELPDGTKVDLNRHEQLRRLPELFFTDPAGASSSSSTSSSIPRKTLFDITCRNDLSIPKLVHNAISNVDVDLRKELCSNIVLCGASSLHPGLEQRLSEELSIKLPKAAKCRVICARSIERQFSSWIGASILTSLGSFQQMWISKLEYEEYGAALTIQRCP